MDEFNNPENPNDPDQNEENDKKLKPFHDEQKKEITPLISPIAAAFIGLFGGFFLYQIIGAALTLIVIGGDIKNAPVDSVRLMTMAGQILFILLPALLFSKWFYEDVSHIIRIKVPKWSELGLFLIGIIILTPLLQNYLYLQNYFFDKLASSSHFFHSIKEALDYLDKLVEDTYGNLLKANSIFEGIFVVIVVSIIPALCEETMFRGFIQRSFEFKMKPVWAALITAIFFGLYHFNPYGLIPLIALGFYFGFAAYTSESIVIPMVLHFLNNFFAIILYFIYGNEELLDSKVDKSIDLLATSTTLIGLLVLFLGVLYLIKKYYTRQRNS